MDVYASVAVNGTEYPETLITGAADAVKNNLPYAAYMVFGHGDIKIVKPTRITAINSDAGAGRLRADYAASLEADEYGGQVLSYFGLSADGETLVMRRDVTPVTKSEGKPFCVLVTVYADFTDGSEKILCGGDNPVARLLLGASPISGEVRIAEGDCDRPNCFSSFALPQSALKPAEMTFGPDGITVSAEVSPAAKDVTAFVGPAPVFRAFLRGGALETKMLMSLTVGADKCVPIDVADAESVFSCESGGVSHTQFKLVRGTEKVTEVFDPLPFSVGRGALIKTDEICGDAAVANDREVMLVAESDGRLTCRFSVPRYNGEDFAACFGGYLALIGDTVRIYGDGGLCEEYHVSGGEQNVIVRDGNAFHFACLKDGTVKRYALSGGSATELPEIAAAEDTKLFGSLFRIGIASREKSYLLDKNDGVNTDAESRRSKRIETFCELAGSARNVRFGGTLMTARRNYADSVIADIYNWTEIVYPAETPARLFGDYAVLKDGTVKEYCRLTNGIRDVAGMPAADADFVIGRIGDFLLAVDSGGGMRTFYCNRSGAYLYCPTCAEGDKVTVGVRARSDPFAGASAVRVNFGVGI